MGGHRHLQHACTGGLEVSDSLKTRWAVKSARDLRGGSPLIEAFQRINEVPSLVIDGAVIREGVYTVYLRYHRSDEENLWSALAGSYGRMPDFAVEKKVTTEGFLSSFEEICSAMPLTYYQLDCLVPPEYIDISHDPVITSLGVKWTREMKYLLEDNFRAVFYDDTNIIGGGEDWVSEISREERIYAASFSNPVVERLVNGITADRTVAMAMPPQRLYGRSFHLGTFVPDIVRPDFFRIVEGVSMELRTWSIRIGQAIPVPEMARQQAYRNGPEQQAPH